MPFTTRAELVSEIAEWLNRTDLTARIDSFISLTDAELKVKLRRAVTRTTLNLDSNAVTLPAGTCGELRSVVIQSSDPWKNRPLRRATPEMIYEARSQASAAGVPRAAAVVNGVLLLDRTPDQTYTAEIICFTPHTALSSGVTSNAVLAESPNVYLYGALTHAAPFLEHDERLPLWKAFYEEAISALNEKRVLEEYGSTVMPVQLPVVF